MTNWVKFERWKNGQSITIFQNLKTGEIAFDINDMFKIFGDDLEIAHHQDYKPVAKIQQKEIDEYRTKKSLVTVACVIM